MAKQKFSELPPAQQRAIVVAGAVQLTLLAAALIDIRRRPQDQIKGPKPLWVGISFINTIGPLAYFFFGRKRKSGEAGPAGADSQTVAGSPAADGFPAVDGSPAADGSPGAAG
ncbi:MAG TPA: PLD nuclease N-terminal domain-containing protein [Streptosporangiaceae bacterium]|nr:PLD nuclease N-terminal domain-containing protein [Streptosporangiaceae bacterium]